METSNLEKPIEIKEEEKEIIETIEEPVKEDEKEKPIEIKEEKPVEKDDVPDVVKQAQEINKKLKQELEDLKTRNSNVFEENEALKLQLEEQKALDKLSIENAEIKAQLEAIKRNTMIEHLIASGKINNNLKAWAENLTFEQLEEFSKHAPKTKTVLDQKNSTTETDEDMQKWLEEQKRSRIIG